MKVPSFFKKSSLKYGLAGLLVALIGYGAFLVMVPVYHEYQNSFAAKEFKEFGVYGTYHRRFFMFADRFANLASLEKENESLRETNARLESQISITDADRAEKDLAILNENLERKLHAESGSALARLPQTIPYEVPTHLSGIQLHALAIGYFRKQEFEKSAVLFQHLLDLKDDRQFEKAENFLMTGISWFHLKDYHLASKQIDEAVRHSEVNDPIHRKGMIWQSILLKAQGQQVAAQNVLLKFIGLYPHSEESMSVNRGQVPAKEEATEHEDSLPTIPTTPPATEEEASHAE